MCGIVGFIDSQRSTATSEQAASMAASIAYRGPDDFGTWADSEHGIAFGHRRLSIIDLTPEGHQPKPSPTGRFVITFNGEIYNYAELKAELIKRGHTFRGTSDTEVMLCSFEEWGVDESLKRFVGMFAFGVWDKIDRVLHIARDRMGEKPLYYGWSGGVFYFASELGAFKAHPAFNGVLNRDSVPLLLRHGYIPAPHSVFQNVFKLPPATRMTIAPSDSAKAPDAFSEFAQEEGAGNSARCKPTYYWSMKDTASAPHLNSFRGNDAEALERLDTLLSEAVKLQMVSDVPLGAFLSGGIDSSMIVALMQKQSSRPVKTFSIGFHEKEYNEANFAKEVATHLGTDHTELYVTSKEALDVIPLLPGMYSEPFADSSQIPTYLVSKLARQHVTVSLSGDAGDELFGGYSRYLWSRKLWNYIRTVPAPLRKVATSIVHTVPPRRWNSVFTALRPVLPKSFGFTDPGYKLHKAASFLSADSSASLYAQLISLWENPSSDVIGSRDSQTLFSQSAAWPNKLDHLELAMWLDTVTYLPDDILVKVDRAAMAVSLEGRVPMLDHRVVEFAWSLPVSMRVRGETSKWLLRELLYRYVPRAMVDRRKMGFGAPISLWLRGPLRDWAESLLDETRLRNEGIFNPLTIRRRWQEHVSGVRDWQYPLWHVLMFQAWQQQENSM